MRLLFFTPGYPPFPGGGEQYARRLAQALAARGHAIGIVTSMARDETDYWRGRDLPARREQDGPVTVWRLPLRPIPGGPRGLALRRQAMVALAVLPGIQTRHLEWAARWFPPLRAETDELDLPAPDLVHAFNLSWEQAALLGRRVARRHGCPYVLTPYAHLNPEVRSPAARTVLMPHQRALLEDADAVLVLSAPVAEGLTHHGVRPRRLAVLGGGLAPPEVVPAPDAPARLALPAEYVLFIGRANADKGALDAARAVLRLRAGGKRIELVLAGLVTPEFRRFAERLSTAERAAIRTLGPVAEADKQALLAGCRLLALPSRTDALGLVILEAWWHGRPVVAARAGGIPGIVRDGEDGLLVPYGDVPSLAGAIGRLLVDPALGDAMGARGRRRVEQEFTWDGVAARALVAYRELLGEPGA